MNKIKIFAALVAALVMTSCGKDYLDTEDTEYLTSEQASEAASDKPELFLNGIWSYMVQYNNSHDDFGYMSIMLASDMTGQDMVPSSFHWFCYDYDFDNRAETYRRTRMHWTILYSMIDKANAIIGTSPKGGLAGNALAIRGLSYYLLIQLFQNPVGADGKINRSLPGVPLIYTSAPYDEGKDQEEKYQGRNTVGEVLDQAQKDLETAVDTLTNTPYDRPSKNYIDLCVAEGLLARLYLYEQEWQKAHDMAFNAIADAEAEGLSIMYESELYAGFYDISNSEWMWGFDESAETSTSYASFFSQISSYGAGYGNGYCTKCIDASLYDQIPSSDYRRNWFTGPDGDGSTAANLPYANKKFGSDGSRTEDYMYMRLSEMYLIMAEATARLDNSDTSTKAAEEIAPLMRQRDKSWASGNGNKSMSVEDILLQRRIELWGEGFGFFDLKRLNRGIDRNYNGTNHLAGYRHVIPAQDKRWIYQIPQKEIQENSQISEDDQNEL